MVRTSRLLVVVLLMAVGAVFSPTAVADVADELSSFLPQRTAESVRSIGNLLQAASGTPLPLPAHPTQALIDATGSLSAALGYDQDPSLAIRAAGLTPEWAGRLANVAQALLTCHGVTSTHFASIPRDQLNEAIKGNAAGLDPARFADIRSCADGLWKATSDLAVTTQTSSPTPFGAPLLGIDVWPVLRVEGGANSVYLNDYLFLVDLGGDDTYINNKGSNMVDVKFGPAGSVALNPGLAARGCQLAIPGLTNADCVPTAAVLLDVQGDDVYGVKQSPDVDAQCTADPVIRRMVTGGVGFLGAGFLVDLVGDDRYTGKTSSLGSGHVFGVGILNDRGGNDSYLAVRNSQGFSLVSALGILRDEGGNDSYDFYLPAPLDPNAPNETPGAGGVIDDVGVCDNRLRFLQGAGNVLAPSIGILIENSGNDTYRGGFSADFLAPANPEGTRGGSQGFGNNGGNGILLDRGGADSYTIAGNQGAPARGNGAIIAPAQDSTGPGGLFVDR